jgi:TPP-dependent trihydroxycyclohexane-1,2-dione (THcHDO) dehydratase
MQCSTTLSSSLSHCRATALLALSMEWRNEMQIRARLVRQPRRHVVALEGDGSLLMQLGCLSTIAALKPKKLTIVIMDNGVARFARL